MIWMPSGDVKPIKVPVSKNMSDAHLKEKVRRKARTMVTVTIVDGQVCELFSFKDGGSCI